MSTRTSSRPTTRTARPSTGRFARTSSAPRSRPTTRRTPPNRYGMAGGVLQRRRTPPPSSGLKGALGGLGSKMPSAGRARAKATPSSKKGKAGGFALLTAAAGFAFSNRDKLSQLIKQRGNSDSRTVAPAEPGTPAAPADPATPPPTTP